MAVDVVQIRQLFTPEEEGYLICRVGYLNIFYPVIPEGWIELDCSRREERQASSPPIPRHAGPTRAPCHPL